MKNRFTAEARETAQRRLRRLTAGSALVSATAVAALAGTASVMRQLAAHSASRVHPLDLERLRRWSAEVAGRAGCGHPDGAVGFLRSALRVFQPGIDRTRCDGHAHCAELLPELIRLDDWGYPMIEAGPVPRHLVATPSARWPRARCWR